LLQFSASFEADTIELLSTVARSKVAAVLSPVSGVLTQWETL